MLSTTICVDPTLGRIEKSALPQQTLMELLIEHITNKEIIYGPGDAPKAISEWHTPLWGVHLDASGSVIIINFDHLAVIGSLQLEWLPETTRRCVFGKNWLTGTVALENLPESLECLNLRQNELDGTLCLTNLPAKMEELILSSNRFSGSLDLTCLPVFMTELDLSENQFVGVTDFRRLPDALSICSVAGNTELEGELTIPRGKSFLANNTKVTVDVGVAPKTALFS